MMHRLCLSCNLEFVWHKEADFDGEADGASLYGILMWLKYGLLLLLL